MSIDERLRRILQKHYRCSHHQSSDLGDDEALSEIKKIIAEELPKGIKIDEWDEDIQVFQTGYNAYRNELLSKLGVKE